MRARLPVFASFLALACQVPPEALDADVLPVVIQRAPCAAEPIAAVTLEWPDSTLVLPTSSRADARFELPSIEGLSIEPEGAGWRVRAQHAETRSLVVPVTLTCPDDATAGTASLAVTLHAPNWGPAIEWSGAAGPPAREHPVAFIDPSSADTLWLFGGFGFVPRQFTVGSDLWKLDLRTNTWSSVVPVGALPASAGGRAVYDPDAHLWWLVGGTLATGGVETALYTLDVTSDPPRFTRVTPSGQTLGTQLEALAIDPAHHRLLSFAGVTTNSVLESLSSFSLSTHTWSDATPMTGDMPDGRYGSFTALDTAGQQLIVFSGARHPIPGDSINPAPDTWALSFAADTPAFTLVEGETAAAEPRRNGCSAFDTAHRRMYIWSGTPDASSAIPQLSMLDVSEPQPHWRVVDLTDPPPARGSCVGVFDAARHRVLFGFGNSVSARFTDLQVLEL